MIADVTLINNTLQFAYALVVALSNTTKYHSTLSIILAKG